MQQVRLLAAGVEKALRDIWEPVAVCDALLQHNKAAACSNVSLNRNWWFVAWDNPLQAYNQHTCFMGQPLSPLSFVPSSHQRSSRLHQREVHYDANERSQPCSDRYPPFGFLTSTEVLRTQTSWSCTCTTHTPPSLLYPCFREKGKKGLTWVACLAHSRL